MNVSTVPHRGRPANSPRLTAGLLYLQHVFDLSDEDVLWQWFENLYWVRRKIGKVQVVRAHYDEGIESHIAPSRAWASPRRAAKRWQRNVRASHGAPQGYRYRAVMEKAIAHPTDSRLLKRCRKH
ncbi:transposase [Mycetohabitans rhizoxinica]|uniref:Transposase n=1 Tax=Mycetohabitans rhizoxinica (strain DSM 19002 / CIP 109453 / HKI 454) TaxID=882378 RepID=E5ARV4_MYCRK|nr:transposase [Mycetohabitans sp. B2]MCG1047345.1 transposase [Mycetohabitans sp. B6]CBW75336.1 Transposase [Mycetohabitans rhizoxinica HKI 454]